MYIEEIRNKIRHKVRVGHLLTQEFDFVSEGEFFFDWRLEKTSEVLKLFRQDTGEILGLMSVENVDQEWMYKINLLSVSKANSGSRKKYDRIVGNLITYVCKRAVEDFGEKACVILIPKTNLRQYYMDKYLFKPVGYVLCLTIMEMFKLFEEYDHD